MNLIYNTVKLKLIIIIYAGLILAKYYSMPNIIYIYINCSKSYEIVMASVGFTNENLQIPIKLHDLNKFPSKEGIAEIFTQMNIAYLQVQSINAFYII